MTRPLFVPAHTLEQLRALIATDVSSSVGQTWQQWYEVVKTNTDMIQTAPPSGNKDPIGFPTLTQPAFRKTDASLIQRDSPKVEQWLDRATGKFGVHWLLLYVAPSPGTQSIDDPHTYAQAVSMSKTKELGKPGWDQYQPMAQATAEQELQKFLKEYEAQGVDLNNTIVYIKPTSRVHTLGAWQQAHNIGHAVWDYAKKDGRVVGKFIQALREIVTDLHQQYYDQGRKPNIRELVIMLGRVLGCGASFRRIFTATDGKLDAASFRANTAFNGSSMEAMYDLIAVYLNSGGKFPMQAEGPIKDTKVADRAAAMEPNAEIQRKFNPRPFVWEPLKANTAQWQEAANKLEDVMGDAFRSVTWGKMGKPIYSTTGYLTTSA